FHGSILSGRKFSLSLLVFILTLYSLKFFGLLVTWVLFTRVQVLPLVVVESLRKAMVCTSIIVAQGKYPYKRPHFYIGIWNEQGIPRGSAPRRIRNALPEFDNVQIDVTFYSAWNTLCRDILELGKDPLVWGRHSLEDIIDIVKAKAQHLSPKKRKKH
ncbi:hypothetical protein GW17_00061912, partial [Ensete ventricosum]